jgi:hypothetical protein
MATITKTFSFLSGTEGFVGHVESAFVGSFYDGSNGSPAPGSLAMYIGGTTPAFNSTNYWEWTGTWEQLGVPAGAMVTSIRLAGVQYRRTGFASAKEGPYTLHASDGTLAATLRSISGDILSTAWTAGQTGSDQPVPGGLQTSNASILLRAYNYLSTIGSTAVQLGQDEISFVITYELPVPVSIDVPGGTLQLAGYSPALMQAFVSAVPAGELLLVGEAPVLVETGDYYVSVGAGELLLAGVVPTLATRTNIAIPAAALILAGGIPVARRLFPPRTGLRVQRWGRTR